MISVHNVSRGGGGACLGVVPFFWACCGRLPNHLPPFFHPNRAWHKAKAVGWGGAHGWPGCEAKRGWLKDAWRRAKCSGRLGPHPLDCF